MAGQLGVFGSAHFVPEQSGVGSQLFFTTCRLSQKTPRRCGTMFLPVILGALTNVGHYFIKLLISRSDLIEFKELVIIL